MKINYLISGGIITNYYCSSQCGHCLYACSPKWEKEYITKEGAGKALEIIKDLGCNSIHIGGGEPMLNMNGLIDVANIAYDMGMNIDYVETNSSWFINEKDAVKKLKHMIDHGIHQLLVSISPFHNEYIPFYKVKGVLNACSISGMKIFPWIMDFYYDIDSFDDKLTHSPAEYIGKFGSDYFKNIPSRYWTHFGGRAAYSFSELFPLKPLEEIINVSGCQELTDTSHFHIDLFQNYIPGLCSGISVLADDLRRELDDQKYPLLNMLYKGGINCFLEYAKGNYNFISKKNYLNKCHLCNDIRLFLVSEKKSGSYELQPTEYYKNVVIN